MAYGRVRRIETFIGEDGREYIKCSPEKADKTTGAACPIGAWSGDYGCYACTEGTFCYEMLMQEGEEDE